MSEGLIKINGSLRISIFTLAQMLNTTPQALLEIIEDDCLARLMDEVADEETVEGEYARTYYEQLLSGVER